MPYENILLTLDGPVATLAMNRPPMNPLNLALLKEMQHAVDQVAANADIRVLVITGGTGKAFVAGADIKAMVAMSQEEIVAFGTAGQGVMRSLENLDKPVIAQVDGFALGGGTELAISCDLILASTRSKFGQPEVKLGIIPGFGGTQRLSRLVGRNMAKELIYRGNIINAEEALRIGLVNHLVPPEELAATVKTIVDDIVAAGPIAVAKAKEAINMGYHKELDEGNRIEVEAFFGTFATADRLEGMRAFLEKRPPRFENK